VPRKKPQAAAKTAPARPKAAAGAEEELRRSEEQFRALVDQAQDSIFVHDLAGRFLLVNQTACDTLGYTREELLRLTVADLDPDFVAREDIARFWSSLPATFEAVHRRRDGSLFPVEVRLSAVHFGERQVIHAAVRDITGRKAMEEALRRAKDELETRVAERTRELAQANAELTREVEERKRAEMELQLAAEVFEHSLEGITITDRAGNILKVNPAFTAITGYSQEEVLGRNPRVLKSDRHDENFYQEMWRGLLADGRWEGEIWNRRKSGESYPEWLSISAVKDAAGRTTHYVAVFHDITEAKESEEQIRFQAYHDALTGLPNRLLLKDRLAVAINHAQRSDGKVAVLFLDLDNFKNINDSLGHIVGDWLLQSVAYRLLKLMRDEDTVARLGGDEFVVMIEDVVNVREAVLVAQRIIAAFAAPVVVGSHELFVTPSMGITLFPDDGRDPDTLIKNADLAMYQAKAAGRNDYRLFTSQMNENVTRRLALEGRLRKAVENGELIPFLQPKIDFANGRVNGMEALARWPQEDGGLVSPAEFIPLAEETGLIIPLGEIILERACLAARRLADAGHPDLALAVNLSPKQFRQPDLVARILAILARTGLPPRQLELEITETTLMTDIDKTVGKLRELAEHGIGLAVDDFGTGYSSLFYLKHFPLRALKIDQSFVRDITRDENDANIVRTVIALAHNFNLEVVAEGVETREQLAFLRTHRCHTAQGFLFSRPLAEAGFLDYLRSTGGQVAVE
jgi:diguanylate cyclase (GGDEF)-like protein/PAS domain S-box-containing protein